MKSPLVTIYITNYNYGRYIKQSIKSVLSQSLQNFELLIIDDGSTDNSKEIIETFRDNPKINIIYQQNKGLNVTNNIAMRAAKGQFIMRLDADDFLEPTAIEVMSGLLESDKELGLIFPDYYYVDNNGIRTGEERRHDFEKEVSLYDQPAHGACTMIRLEFLKSLGGYNESFTCQDGYDLWIKFIMHHKVRNVNIPLFSYRRHGENLTTNEERILNTRKLIKEIFVDSNLISPSTLGVIPVRNTLINGINWPLHKTPIGKSILESKVEICLNSKKLKKLVISASDIEIIEHCHEWIHKYKNVLLIERPSQFSQPNESLYRTFHQALQVFQEKNNNCNIDAIMSISLEYPFVHSDVIDDAINTLVLFKSDSVLSVRPDNRMYYQHSGHTLIPILDQDKFTKLEREALYRGVGGIVVSTKDNFLKNKKLIAGSISHIVVDKKTAFGVFDTFDFNLFCHSDDLEIKLF